MHIVRGIRNQLSGPSAQNLRPAIVTTTILSSLLITILEIIYIISFAALIFSGKLANQLPEALGFILLGNAILVGVIALLSSYSGSIAVGQDAPGAILGSVAIAIAATIPDSAVDQQFATVAMMIVLTTALTGLAFLVLGIFRLGSLVRFLPYPVMGGFLAGTGWLLALGGLGIMAGVPPGVEWFGTQTISHWLPGALLGVIMFVSVSTIRQPLVLPILLALGALVFYIAAGAMNLSLDLLNAEGWLLGSVSQGTLSHLPLSAETLALVDWSVLWGQIPSLVPAVFISVIALLLNSTGLELVIRRDIKLNRELVAAGAGNLLAGLLGGLPGYHAISLSTLNHKMSGGRRLVGLAAALLVCLTVFLGASILTYVPKLVLGAVLIYLAVALLFEWVYEAWFKFPRVDFLIIVSVLVVIAISGFLNGIIFGLVLAIIMFVVGYSRVSVVKFAVSGKEYHSRVTRSLQQQQFLEEQGDQLYILKLQGFIFFGTANSIFDQLQTWVQRHSARYVLLDFAQVGGLDSTALLSFARMLQWSQEQKIVLVLTGLRGQVSAQFARGGFHESSDGLRFFPDLDHGVEWCENDVISGASTAAPTRTDLAAQLSAIVGGQYDFEKLLSYLHRREYAADEYLIRQGDEQDMVFFIESGQVTAQLETPNRPPVRLETMGSGRAVGELGFYLEIERTAAVVVDEPSVIYSLSRRELAAMEMIDPETSNLFHRIIVRLLGERVVHLIRVVEALEH